MGNGKTVVQMDKELRTTSEYKIVEEIRGFSRSIELFIGNYRQLKELLIFFEDIGQSLYLDQAGNEIEKLRLMREIMRLMHNYVAAVLSLIDHSRIHYQKLYGANQQFPEYQPMVDQVFAYDPLACFVKDLRQYFQHYGLPGIYLQLYFETASNRMERTVRLRLDDLRLFKKWSNRSKQFLQIQKEDIDLMKLIDAYYDKVTSFYKWFQTQQETIHAEEIKMVTYTKAKMLGIALPDILNATLQFPGINYQDFESSIIKFLDPDEQIMLTLTDLSSRGELLCRFLQAITTLSPTLEKKIKSLYTNSELN